MDPIALSKAKGWRRTYFAPMSVIFWGVHVASIVGVALMGWSWRGFGLAMALYAIRMFFITGAYHRYFSHRSYKTSRAFQFFLALGATFTSQKGVLWWAAHHRTHHRLSDQPGDLHSVKQSGFMWSHIGWIMSSDFDDTDLSRIKDLAKYPELRFLNRFWIVPPILLAVTLYAVGGVWALLWGSGVSQVLSWHGTFTINSLSHLFGTRRYATGDDSRNNWFLAIITMGEGWHNNHHQYQVSARQGFYWWEVDLTYYILRSLAALGLIWDLHPVPRHVRDDVMAPANTAADLPVA